MNIDFKNYFQNKYFNVDRKYVDIAMPRRFDEMAIPFDIAKKPINIEGDDIDFLKQFPAKYWSAALHARYQEDLMHALQGREQERAPVEQHLVKSLKNALLKGQFDTLKGVVSDDLVKKLKGGEYEHVEANDELAEKAAKYLAELETEKKIPHASHKTDKDLPDGYRTYKFRVAKQNKETIDIVAKPMINRLVHRLETTRGREHHPDSGLHDFGDTHGKYGYDLYGAKKGGEGLPHSTRGMQFPTEEEIRSRMITYFNHNMHGMYGKLPDDDKEYSQMELKKMYGDLGPNEGIVWKPVDKMVKDTWAWDKIYRKLYSAWNAKLTKAEPGSFTTPEGEKIPPTKGFGNASNLRKMVHKMAMEDVFKLIEDGKLKTPPIPGVAPQGLPFKIRVKSGGRKLVDAPLLYLPFKKTKIMVKTANGIEEKESEIPLVKPAQYLRELGTEEGDENLDPNSLLGHEKDYVGVDHEDYTKSKGYLAGGALHVTQNSSGRKFLDQSDPEFQERREQIENEMGITGLDRQNKPSKNGEGRYFFDIIKGIWNCIGSACGGMTSDEVSIMKDNVHDLHQIVYQKMMMNLRDEKLDTPAGRRAFTTNVATSWAQQDLGRGGGTRRKRKFDASGRSQEMDRENGDTGGSLKDNIHSSEKERGEMTFKSRTTGRGEFSYNIDNLRKIVVDLENKAKEIDQQRASVEKLSHTEISDQIADTLQSALTDKAALIFKLQFNLKQLFMASGYPDNEAELLSHNKIEAYSSNNATSSEIISNFKGDQEIQMLLKGEKPAQSVTLAQQDALDKFKAMLDQIPPDKLSNGNTQSMIYGYVSKLPEEFRDLAKQEADRVFKLHGSSVSAEPEVKPAVNNQQEVQSLINAKDWATLARNQYFLHVANAQQLSFLINKIEANPQSGGEHLGNLKVLLAKRS